MSILGTCLYKTKSREYSPVTLKLMPKEFEQLRSLLLFMHSNSTSSQGGDGGKNSSRGQRGRSPTA